MAESSFGLTVRAQPLGSQQDSNFLLAEPAGAVAGVLKIANPAFSAAEIEAPGRPRRSWRGCRQRSGPVASTGSCRTSCR